MFHLRSPAALCLVALSGALALSFVGCDKAADAAPVKLEETGQPTQNAEATKPVAETAKPAAGDQTLTFKVDGMVCGGCEQAISDKVSALAGVKSCSADHKKGEAVVVVGGDKVDAAKIAQTITELGYKASTAN